MQLTPGRMPIQVDTQEFEIQWQDHGLTRKLIVFQDGKRIGHKEFTHLVDDGFGVIEYAVKSVLREKSGLSKNN